MAMFEYTTMILIAVGDFPFNEEHELLQNMGQNRWELVSLLPTTNHKGEQVMIKYYFKRKIS